MSSTVLWKFSVITAPAGEEAVAEILQALFKRTPTSYTDFDTGRTTTTVFFEKKPDITAAVGKQLQSALELLEKNGVHQGRASVSLKRIRNRDWAESWKHHFKLIHIGRALLIKPGWSKVSAKPGQATVVLDPGLSFGTGQHPTTAFCLRQVAALRKKERSQSFLDIGTGSGILAIAAARLGYSPVVAFDYDPQAVRIARSNARRNRVLHKIELTEQDVTTISRPALGQHDVVCANLISTLLIQEREKICHCVKPGGALVLAGILRKEFAPVEKAYRAVGMRLLAHREEKEWSSASFARKKEI
jgi:ribosomal protein L11 methyltransferase